MRKIIALVLCMLLTIPAFTAFAQNADNLSGTITISLQSVTGAQEAWTAVANAYTAKHPNVNVVVDLKPSGNYTDWLKAQFQSWSTDHYPEPDLVVGNLAGSDKNDKTVNFFNYSDEKSPYSDGRWSDQFINFSKQPAIDINNGNWDVLGTFSTQILWFYNADIFREVGVKPPTTWNELIDVCEKLQQAGYQPIAIGGDLQSFWELQMGWLVQVYTDQTTRSTINIVRAQPGDYNYDEDIDGKFKYDPTDPYNDDTPANVTVNGLRFWRGLMIDGTLRGDTEGMKTVMSNLAKVFPKYAGGDKFFGTSMEGARTLFYQGKAAMYVDTSGFLGDYLIVKKSIDEDKAIVVGSGDNQVGLTGLKKFDLQTFHMPSMEGPGIEAKARTLEVSTGFISAVKKEVDHNDLVVDFLMYFTSPEGFSTWVNALIGAGGHIDGKPLIKGVELKGELATLLDNIPFIGNCQKGVGVNLARGIGDNQEAVRAWYGYTKDFFDGKITVDEWAEKHQANLLKYAPEVLKVSKISMRDLENPQNEATGND